MKRVFLASALALAVLACTNTEALDGTGSTQDVAESEDGLTGLPLRELSNWAPPAGVGMSEVRKLFTSATSFTSYFGTKPPAGFDFAKEWLVYYSAGPQSSGGYKALVTRARMEDDELIVSTRLEQPGPDCAVTMAITHPQTLVAIARPLGANWLLFTKYTKTNNCPLPPPTCAVVDCAPGATCVMVGGKPECRPLPSLCAATSCPVGSNCVEHDGKASCIPVITCANIKCSSGTHCVDNGGSAFCEPDLTCAAMLCAPGSYCVEEAGPTAHCATYSTCMNVKCTSGTTCVDLPIQCFKAPCAPTAPQCVSGTFSCPSAKYINCMPPTTNAACKDPQKSWIQANCPNVQYVY